MNLKKNVFIIGLIVIVSFIIISSIWFNISLKSVKNVDATGMAKTSESKKITINIQEGMGSSQIVDLLEKNDVIKSALATKIYIKINKISGLKAGKYVFDNTENTKQILEHIVNGDVSNGDVKITFIEGKNIRWIAKTIAENTNNTENDVFELLKNEEYLDSLIEKYWFITEEIKDERIYYPLEGYLLPDTYTFDSKDVSVETIFNVILNYMEKYLNEKKDEFENQNLTIHQILTLASMAELEGKKTEDRAEIIGVFFNRLYSKMSLGSDVTAYYAFKIDMGDRDLTVKELNTENPYNTRGPGMNSSIPVGPICNPSKSAIDATLNYKKTDAYYFVADKNGDVYFTKNNDEHNKIIQKLKKEGLWYIYN